MVGCAGTLIDDPSVRDGLKASERLTARRVWQEFDAFVEGRTGRWAGRAEAVLYSEGNRAAAAYARSGEGAAIEVVDDAEWAEYISRLWITTVPEAGKIIEPYIAAAKAAVADPLLIAAREWLRQYGAREAAMLSNTSRKGIADQIRIGLGKGESTDQIAQRIRKQYRSIEKSRAGTIARTEVHAASNYGSLSAAAESQIPLDKIWVDTPDERTRDMHVDAGGQKRTLNAPFLVGGEQLMHPGDGSLGASSENLVNCRCTLFYVRAARRVRRPRAA